MTCLDVGLNIFFNNTRAITIIQFRKQKIKLREVGITKFRKTNRRSGMKIFTIQMMKIFVKRQKLGT